MKLNVFTAAGQTLTFPFRHALGVLHVVWLPTLMQVAGYFLLMPGYLQAAAMMGADPPADGAEVWSRLSPFVFQALLFLVISVSLTVIMFNGLTRLVVRGEKPGLPVLLRWGADEWRVLAGWLLFGLIVAGLQLAAIAGGFVVRGIMALGPGPGVILSILVSVAIFIVGVWICVRLSLLVPATLAEQRIGLGPSWERTEDDFWALLGFWAIFVIVSLVVQLLLTGFLTPPGYFEAFQSAGFGSPEAMREATRKANEVLAKSYDLSDSANVTRMLAGYLISIVGAIFMAIAGAVCWRQMADAPIEAATP